MRVSYNLIGRFRGFYPKQQSFVRRKGAGHANNLFIKSMSFSPTTAGVSNPNSHRYVQSPHALSEPSRYDQKGDIHSMVHRFMPV